MKKILFLILFASSVTLSHAQDMNNYKYILIPSTYEFTNGTDQYRLNSLTKFLFEKEGFNTLMTNEKKPVDLQKDPCLALNTDVKNNSGIFVTKLVITLTNCSGEVVFESEEGRSREKDFQAAYQEALRDAFESIKELNYNYTRREVVYDEKEAAKEKPEVIMDETAEASEPEDEEAPKPVKIATEPKAIVDANETGDSSKSQKKATDEKLFQYDGQKYKLKPTTEGFGLYIENSPEPIALLLKSGSGNSFIYNSLSNQGIAYFDNQGNLVVEYLNRQTNEKTTIVYLKKY